MKTALPLGRRVARDDAAGGVEFKAGRDISGNHQPSIGRFPAGGSEPLTVRCTHNSIWEPEGRGNDGAAPNPLLIDDDGKALFRGRPGNDFSAAVITGVNTPGDRILPVKSPEERMSRPEGSPRADQI